MTKLIDLGHATPNDESVDSPKFKIKLFTEKCGNSGNKNGETISQSYSQPFVDLVTEIKPNRVKPLSSLVSGVVTTQNSDVVTGGNNADGEQSDGRDFVTTVTTCYHADSESGNSTKDNHSNGSNKVVTTVTTFSQVNENIFKIGDRAKLVDDIFTINKIEDDGCYIGGHSDSVQSVSADRSPVNPQPIDDENIRLIPLGNNSFQIVGQKQVALIDRIEGVEYEC